MLVKWTYMFERIEYHHLSNHKCWPEAGCPQLGYRLLFPKPHMHLIATGPITNHLGAEYPSPTFSLFFKIPVPQ